MAITANMDTLLSQASTTADQYLREAVDSIDNRFHKGYAKDHPELVAAFMSSAGKDFNNAVMIVAIQEASEAIASALQQLQRP